MLHTVYAGGATVAETKEELKAARRASECVGRWVSTSLGMASVVLTPQTRYNTQIVWYNSTSLYTEIYIPRTHRAKDKCARLIRSHTYPIPRIFIPVPLISSFRELYSPADPRARVRAIIRWS